LLIVGTGALHAQTQSSVATYAARADRSTHSKPPLPQLGPAGFTFTDPAFGSRMLRVTDASTRPGAINQSYTTPSAAHQTAWNANSTYFYLRSVDGYFVPYAFNASSMSASRIQPTGSGAGGLVVNSQTEPQFSFVSPNILYVSRQDSTYDWPIIRQFDFSTGAYTDLLNLGEVAPIAHSTYTGGLSSSAGATERVMAFFGGAAQDQHYLVAVFAANNPRSLVVLDTTNSTTTVNDQRTNTNIPLGFHLHHAFLDKSGQYVILETTAVDRGSPNYSAPLYVWDTIANTFTALPETGGLSGGHYATGFGTLVNQDCCTSTSWDAAQWQFRPLATPNANHDLVTVLTPQETYSGDHPSWNNAQPTALVPFVTAFYRTPSETAPWRPWDDEIVAVQTDGSAANATVWRFAHHRTSIVSFWDMPRANVSQDGRFAIFTSNWEKTLGTDPGSGPREDVFLVELTGSTTASPSPAPSPTPAPAPTPAPTPSPTPSPAPTPAPPVSTSAAFEPARWMGLINVSASGNNLEKTSGCGGCPDASAASEQHGTAVQFTADTGALRFIGLGSGTIGAQPSDINFAVRLQNGTAEVRESGAYRSETSFAAGDTLKITADGSGVRYWKNGAVFFVSASQAVPSLRIQAVMSDSHATITNIMVQAVR
jgi:hypothetical protein